MLQSAAMDEGREPDEVVHPAVAPARLAIGLLQGALLYWLYRSMRGNLWPSTDPYLFAPLVLVGLLVPVLLIASLGNLPAKKAGLWTLAATGILIALAMHDIWRGGAGQGLWGAVGSGWHLPSGLLVLSSAAGLFLAQTLVTAAAKDGRRIARYPTYFEHAWKLAIQLKFSGFFLGALWAVLWMGALLFMLVKLSFLQKLLTEAWFVIPVSCFAYAGAMHLCDVRPGIVRAIRMMALALMSWYLPVAVLMVGGFLFSLLSTDLATLWGTRSATTVLLGSAAMLIKLINAAFQDGEAGAGVNVLVRVSARVAALLLLPVCGVAVYALGLRVREYGWSGDRVIAAACLLVACCYALGYFWAALRFDSWLGPIANVNVATTFVILAVLLALLSPLADPSRLSVASQMARLNAGEADAATFDFDYLRAHGARYGRRALERLRDEAQGPEGELIRKKAALALANGRRAGEATARAPQPAKPAMPPAPALDVGANLTVWPQTARLPESFLRQDWRQFENAWQLPPCMKEGGRTCDAYLFDADGDERPEILLLANNPTGKSLILKEGGNGAWGALAELDTNVTLCAPLEAALRANLRAGQFQPIAAQVPDLLVAGQRVRVFNRAPSGERPACPTVAKP